MVLRGSSGGEARYAETLVSRTTNLGSQIRVCNIYIYTYICAYAMGYNAVWLCPAFTKEHFQKFVRLSDDKISFQFLYTKLQQQPVYICYIYIYILYLYREI